MSTRNRPVLGLAVLALPTALVAIDISVLAVALPRMAEDLGATRARAALDGRQLQLPRRRRDAHDGRRGRPVRAAARHRRLCGWCSPWPRPQGRSRPRRSSSSRRGRSWASPGSALMPASLALIGVMFTQERARVQAMGAYMTVFLVSIGGGAARRWAAASPAGGGARCSSSACRSCCSRWCSCRGSCPRPAPTSRRPSTSPSAAMSLAVDPAARLRAQDGVDDGLTSTVVGRHRRRRWSSGVSSCAGSTASSTRCSTSTSCGTRRRPTLVVLFLTALLMGGSSLFFNLYLQEVQGLTPLVAAVWMLPRWSP